MKIILDVNIVFAALIKGGKVREIILKSGFDFYFPEVALHKLRKYENYILEKSGLSKEALQQLLFILFKYISIIPTESIAMVWKDAMDIIGKVDEEDVAFISSALAVSNSIIWSDDRHFERQNRVVVLKTKDVFKLVS